MELTAGAGNRIQHMWNSVRQFSLTMLHTWIIVLKKECTRIKASGRSEGSGRLFEFYIFRFVPNQILGVVLLGWF